MAQYITPEAIQSALSSFNLTTYQATISIAGTYNGGESRIIHVHVTTPKHQHHQSLSLRLYHPDIASPELLIAIVKEEARIYELLASSNFTRAPRLLATSLTFTNALQQPFLVLDWIDGESLQWTDEFPARKARYTVLCQLAYIQIDLLECTLETRSTTAADFFKRRISSQLTRIRNGHLPGLTENDAADQLALLESVLGSDADCALFALDHGDLKPSNIIVDGDHNIKGVIDWGFAAVVPLVQAARLPCFLWPRESAATTPSEAMLRDREAYVDSYRSQTSTVVEFMKRWQDGDNVAFRTLHLESMCSKGMFASMASIGWKLPYGEHQKES